eukprot:465754-Amorphochlora_amoeboformis.AAC.1
MKYIPLTIAPRLPTGRPQGKRSPTNNEINRILNLNTPPRGIPNPGLSKNIRLILRSLVWKRNGRRESSACGSVMGIDVCIGVCVVDMSPTCDVCKCVGRDDEITLTLYIIFAYVLET